MNDSIGISRRSALKRLAVMCGIAGAVVPALEAQAAELPHLSTTDPTAKALGYTEEAAQVDKKKYPTYTAGQMCSTCMQLQGAAGQPYRPCNIFAGKAVNANGWCQAYVKKA